MSMCGVVCMCALWSSGLYTKLPHHASVSSVVLSGADASMFHEPLIGSPFLSSVTAVIPKAPGAVHQHLLRQHLQHPRLHGPRAPQRGKDRGKGVISHRHFSSFKAKSHATSKQEEEKKNPHLNLVIAFYNNFPSYKYVYLNAAGCSR